VRGEAPRHALALAPEGRALLDVHQASRRAGGFGVPRPVLASLKPPQLAALRTLGLRLPAGVKEPAQAAAAGRPASPGVPGLNLERRWNGFETGPEGRRYFHVTFQGNGGTFGFEGGLNLSVPLTSVEQTQRGVVTFELNLGGSVRHYAGRWDGDKISGTVSTDPEGRQALGSFELTPE
jgi:hypothetical protein